MSNKMFRDFGLLVVLMSVCIGVLAADFAENDDAKQQPSRFSSLLEMYERMAQSAVADVSSTPPAQLSSPTSAPVTPSSVPELALSDIKPEKSRLWRRRTSAVPSPPMARRVKGSVVTTSLQNHMQEPMTPRRQAVFEAERKHNSLVYADYLRSYQDTVKQILESKTILDDLLDEEESACIHQAVSKAVRDVCSDEHQHPSHTIINTDGIAKISKTMALLNLKKILDHLASFLNQHTDPENHSTAEAQIRRLLQQSSIALVSCKEIPSNFELRSNLLVPGSVISPRLVVARSGMRAMPELTPEVSKTSERSVNVVHRVRYAEETVAFAKSCLDKAKYAEKANQVFAGINDMALAVFSSLHKHEVNFHVPVIHIDDSEQKFWSIIEGFDSLKNQTSLVSQISPESVQEYFILALLFNFSDSHLENIRVGKDVFGTPYLISIDHAEALQVYYEVPGTATLRLGQYLELFREHSQREMLPYLRRFLMGLDPRQETNTLARMLRHHVDKLAEHTEDATIEDRFNRKLDHFRLNLEVLKAVASIDGSTFDDVFEIRRSQFRKRIVRKKTSMMKNMAQSIRGFFVRDSLVQIAIKSIKKDSVKERWKLVGENDLSSSPINMFDPSLWKTKSLEDAAFKKAPNYKKHNAVHNFPVDFRLTEADFQQMRSMITDILYPLIHDSARYHRMEHDDVKEYGSIGF